MDNWRKKSEYDSSIVYEYGDGKGSLVFRLYCVVGDEDNIKDIVPAALFYGYSELPDPSFIDIEKIIEAESICNSDIVVCSISEKCKDPDCNDVAILNNRCYWRI